MRRCRRGLLLACGLLAGGVQAETRAWLDADQASVGRELVLHIETDQVGGRPDLAPLLADFELVDQTSSRSARWINGKVSARTAYEIVLVPRREGLLPVPAIRVGNESSKPLSLQVVAGDVAAIGNADAFLETLVDDAQPYVQQSVGLVLRFNYTDAVYSGSFGIDVPDGASLQQVGQDRYSRRTVAGREYKVAERSFVLVPERSGPLSIPAPRFQGRGNMDLFGQLFGGGQALHVRGQARVLQVRPQPADAPQPWLPLRDLRLRYIGKSAAARLGEATLLTVEAVAEGAIAAQLPALPLPVVDGGQVFAEPAQFDEHFIDGVPRVTLTQRFSIVPARAGSLRVQPLRVDWFDAGRDGPRQALLPELLLDVAAASTPPATVAADTAMTPAIAGLPRGEAAVGASPWWPRLAALFALLWLLTLVWAVSRRGRPGSPQSSSARLDPQAVQGAGARHGLADLRRALDSGTLEEVGEVLRGMHAPPLADLDALRDALDDRRQRQALEALRRARWADGDGARARSALRDAFSGGPRWRGAATRHAEPLEPLYPER